MILFAYGALLDIALLLKICPGSRTVGRARLLNHRLAFPTYSNSRAGGVSCVVPAPGHEVRGALYEIPDQEVPGLDAAHRVPEGRLVRERYLILGEDGRVEPADLYRAVKLQGDFPPARSYMDDMIRGARQHALDPIYIQWLESLVGPTPDSRGARATQ